MLRFWIILKMIWFLGQRRWRNDDGGRGGRKRPAGDFGDGGAKRAKVTQNGWR